MNQNIQISILMVLAITLTAALTMSVQSVKALPGAPCSPCAKDFAPGHINKQPSTTTFG